MRPACICITWKRPRAPPERWSKHGAEVFGQDLHRLGRLLAAGPRERLGAADRLFPLGMERRQVGVDLLDVLAGDELGQVHPVSADVGDGPQVRVAVGLDPPVVVVGQEQPVLGVGARDGEDAAQVSPGDAGVHLLAEGIEAEVVIDPRGLLGTGRGDLHQLGRLLSS